MNEACENCPNGAYISWRDTYVRQLQHDLELNQRLLDLTTTRDRFNGRKATIERYIAQNKRDIEIFSQHPVSSQEVADCTGPFERATCDDSLEKICGAVVMNNLAQEVEFDTALPLHEE